MIDIFQKWTARIAVLLLVSVAGSVLAQDLSAAEVLENVKAEAEATRDATFLLTGRLIDPDGTSINLEVELEVIPEERAARASFFQPDALADNVIVVHDGVVYNYIFLTNQVTVFDADDPDALGGLFSGQEAPGRGEGEAEEGAGLDLTLDLDRLFAGWEAEIESYENGSYRLRLDNTEEGAMLDHVFATVEEGTWVPRELVLVGQDETTIAELFVEDFLSEPGLSVEDVTYIPEDAEVIDERD